MSDKSATATLDEKRMKPMQMTEETLDRFIKTVNVSAVFGEPVKAGENVIIPTAQVMGGMGFGAGFGSGRQGRGEEAGNTGEGGGSGGGGRSMSRPVAAVVASPEGVRVEPVIDKTRITLTGMIAGALLGLMFIRRLRA
ncbi:MAG: spore germination protein GerW family protein [Thermoleophilia bacterium]